MTETAPKRAPIQPADYTVVQKGWRICVTGIGIDNLVHEHHTVTDVTKIYIKSEATTKRGKIARRHRRDTGKSVPYSPYGGSQVNTTCARRKG